MTTKDRIEAAIRHIQTASDVDPWAMELAVNALKAQMDKPMKLSTVCLLCKKPAITFSTDDDIPYTNYSYCEDCLRKGLKLLKAQPIMALPSAQPQSTMGQVNDTAQSTNDCISRHAAIELIERMKPYHQNADDIAEMIANMPSAQPDMSEYSSKLWRNAYERGKKDAQQEEDCDTCKHGYFGDDQCNNCRVRYPSHYERRTK